MKKIAPTLLHLAGTVALCGTLSTEARQTRPIQRIETPEKLVALTFDDGPDSQTIELLKLLHQYDCKATFFVRGDRLEKHPDITRKAFAAGHEIGNHAWSHKKLPELPPNDVEQEITRTQELIKEVTGTAPALFRAPYLQYDEATWKVLNDLNLTAINASSSTKDWDRATTTKQIIESATGDQLQPGSIILMHSWPPNTLEAMPVILKRLKEMGYRCVTVSDLVRSKKTTN